MSYFSRAPPPPPPIASSGSAAPRPDPPLPAVNPISRLWLNQPIPRPTYISVRPDSAFQPSMISYGFAASVHAFPAAAAAGRYLDRRGCIRGCSRDTGYGSSYCVAFAFELQLLRGELGELDLMNLPKAAPPAPRRGKLSSTMCMIGGAGRGNRVMSGSIFFPVYFIQFPDILYDLCKSDEKCQELL